MREAFTAVSAFERFFSAVDSDVFLKTRNVFFYSFSLYFSLVMYNFLKLINVEDFPY